MGGPIHRLYMDKDLCSSSRSMFGFPYITLLLEYSGNTKSRSLSLVASRVSLARYQNLLLHFVQKISDRPKLVLHNSPELVRLAMAYESSLLEIAST